ncbi:MAG: copper resistance protein CopC [Gammaproteobacteria bacterium]|nr:copper resistance protein CopC [Gammaproteobacteria bacterium]MYA36685.1 copper resistance protein CopC [Gammaproteobacteria bacterium]MYE28301.1 copper resistance protein CopC [Gammaproteobacteria bacterium]MYH84983.1 copper resistance protein CopC [Gammaproteobacteria bacterium]MYI02075.1 copper resistance protein CopC [Gammaproteobacteria bacterium]
MQSKSIFRFMAVLAALIVSLAAYAHTPLKTSSPAADSTVAQASAIEVEFNGPVRLVRLQVMHGEVEVPTEFAVNPEPVAAYRIDAPDIPAGKITVEWAAIGADGHTLTDTFSFTVDPNAAATAGN